MADQSGEYEVAAVYLGSSEGVVDCSQCNWQGSQVSSGALFWRLGSNTTDRCTVWTVAWSLLSHSWGTIDCYTCCSFDACLYLPSFIS